MASTIDWAKESDQDLLFGYQRANRTRFPDNFIAITGELHRRGLSAPEKFEIDALGADSALSLFQKLGDGLSTIASKAFSRDLPSPQA